MKLKINIDIKRIGLFKVTEKIENDDNVRNSTINTAKILCEQIDKYFKDNKIKTKSTFELVIKNEEKE